MRDIINKWFDTVSEDTTMIGLLGITTTDDRVYLHDTPDPASLSTTQRAFITYGRVTTSERDYGGVNYGGTTTTFQRGDLILQVDIWGKDHGVLDQVSERLDELFEGEKLTCTNHVVQRVSRIDEIDDYDPEWEVNHIITRWRFGPVLRINP